MKIKDFLCGVMLLYSVGSFAQTPVKEYYTEYSSFNKPLIIDSVNNQGKTFLVSDYLKTPKLKDGRIDKYNLLADEVMKVRCEEKFLAKDYLLANYYFEITCNTNQKVEFKVISNAAIKLSIDAEQQKEKLDIEDSITDTSCLKIEKTLAPGSHIVGIALMMDSKGVKEGKYTLQAIMETPDIMQGSNNGLTLQNMLCGETPSQIMLSESGNMYMVRYYDVDNKGGYKYRQEVRQTKDDKVIYKDNKYTSYQWMKGQDILIKKEGNTLTFIDPATSMEVREKITIPIEGSVEFLGDENNYIISHTDKKDNTSGDLRRIYMPDDRIPGWRDRTSLYLVNNESTSPLFYTYRSTYLNDISPDNSKILISMTKDSITKRPFSFTSIYEYDLVNHTFDTIVKEDGFVSNAQYLLDGQNIVVVASNEAFNSIGSTVKKGQIPNAFNYSIYLINLKTKAVSPVAKNFSPCVDQVFVRENNLYLKCTDKDSINIYKYNIASQTFEKLELGVDIVSGFDISKDEKTMVYFGENYNKPKRVFRLQEGDITEVYFPKKDAYSKLQIGEMKTFSFKMHGSMIDGRLYYPADFDASKKYPMIVYYYGGCSPTDRSFEMRYSAYLYTQQGYIVYVINPSGTVGWGQEFAARHTNAWGDYTADEIIEGVKQVIKNHPYVDAKHIGCMGASYGGFMTQYLQTKTDIFACAISHAGISNITSYWGEGYWGYSYSGAASAESYPWNNPELYTKHSPLFNADKIHTPLLLLHGTADTNVPIGESIQMYNALKILGREVEFVTVKDENHGIVDFNKRMQWNNTIYAWFAKWLKDDASWWNTLYPQERY